MLLFQWELADYIHHAEVEKDVVGPLAEVSGWITGFSGQ